jgi:hypothetical protein
MYLITRQDIVNDDLVVIGIAYRRPEDPRSYLSIIDHLLDYDIKVYGKPIYAQAYQKDIVSGFVPIIIRGESEPRKVTLEDNYGKKIVTYTVTPLYENNNYQLHEF